MTTTYIVNVDNAIKDFKFTALDIRVTNMPLTPELIDVMCKASLTTIVDNTSNTVGDSLYSIANTVRSTGLPELEYVKIENTDLLYKNIVELALVVVTAIFNNIDVKNRNVYHALESYGIDYITIIAQRNYDGKF